MCGTGRLSGDPAPGGRLTCVDYSAGLLAVLARTVQRERLPARLVETDVKSLVLAGSCDRAFIGFNSFSELVTDDDALAALPRHAGRSTPVHAAQLRPEEAALDGRWHDYGTGPVVDSENQVGVHGRYLLRAGGDVVDGVQV